MCRFDAETATKTRPSGFNASTEAGDHSPLPLDSRPEAGRAAREGPGPPGPPLEAATNDDDASTQASPFGDPRADDGDPNAAPRSFSKKAENVEAAADPPEERRGGAAGALARSRLPSCPNAFDPNANTSPELVTTALCRFAAATSTANASRSAPVTARGVRWYADSKTAFENASGARAAASRAASLLGRTPYPSLPSAARPQEKTTPRLVTASVWCFPAATRVTKCARAGKPSRAGSANPAASLFRRRRGGKGTGVGLNAAPSPSYTSASSTPSRPPRPCPQLYTDPSRSATTEWNLEASKSRTPPPTPVRQSTRRGVAASSQVPWPSW